MDVLINIIELASDLAHTRTLYESGDASTTQERISIFRYSNVYD